jgi:hypothetical protein
MEIRFTSTLTREDEELLAEAVFELVKRLLTVVPIGYMLQIDTTNGRVFHDSRVTPSPLGPSRGDFSREKPTGSH